MNNQLSLDDMAEQFKLELKADTKRLIANVLNHVAKSHNDNLTTVRKKTVGDNGKHQSYMVTAYPEHYVDMFEKLCLLLGCWN